MKRIVVFASGSGTNFQALIDAVNRGDLKAELSGLIASRAGIGALDRAREADIPLWIINPADYSGSDEFGEALLERLNDIDPDLVVLAGYLVKIPSTVIAAYEGRIINIHPSLLPKYGGQSYYGIRVHEAVLKAGECESGCTVHLVTDNYDEGPVLAQERVKVLPDDTPESLAGRILEREHKLLPAVVQQLLDQTT